MCAAVKSWIMSFPVQYTLINVADRHGWKLVHRWLWAPLLRQCQRRHRHHRRLSSSRDRTVSCLLPATQCLVPLLAHLPHQSVHTRLCLPFSIFSIQSVSFPFLCYILCKLGLERYWHWGIGYCPIFSSIGYWAILLLAVIPNTNTAWTPWYHLPADDSREIGEEIR